MDIDLKKDLSTITTINEQVLTKFIEKIEWCISDGIEKLILSGEDSIKIDIGIGFLIITLCEEGVKYKFIPSEHLEKVISNTVINEKNLFVCNLEQSVITKFTNVYKNFF